VSKTKKAEERPVNEGVTCVSAPATPVARKPGDGWRIPDLLDAAKRPPWPSAEPGTPAYAAENEARASYDEARAALMDRIALARILARRRLPLTTRFCQSDGEAVREPTEAVLCHAGGLVAGHPLVTAWRLELQEAVRGTLLVTLPGGGTDMTRSLARAEDVRTCLRLLLDDEAARGQTPADAPVPPPGAYPF
jgi:hypothetical protein